MHLTFIKFYIITYILFIRRADKFPHNYIHFYYILHSKYSKYHHRPRIVSGMNRSYSSTPVAANLLLTKSSVNGDKTEENYKIGKDLAREVRDIPD